MAEKFLDQVQGKAWCYGDDINTDVIFPGKYTYTISDKQEMAQHALEDLDPDFISQVKSGDVIVAGKNFGCGSSREQAAICLKYAGVSAVIARSFARIFFRNAINQGLLVIQSPQAVDYIEAGQKVEISFSKGQILVGNKKFTFPPLSSEIMAIVEKGGLVPYVRDQIARTDTE